MSTKNTKSISGQKQTGKALKQSNERLEILAETARLLLSSESPESIVQTVCEKVLRHLDCNAFFNYLVDEDRGAMRLNAYAGISASEAKKIEWLDFGVAVCGCVGRDGKRMIAEDIQNSTDEITCHMRAYGIDVYACHPITYQGRTIGTLSFGACSRTHFLDEDLEMLRTITDQVATALARKHLEDGLRRSYDEMERRVTERTMELRRVNEELTVQIEERRRAEEMIFRLNRLYEVLSKVNEAIVRIHTPDELYERICRIAVETGAFAMAWVGLTDPVTKRIEPVVKYGDSRGYLTGVKIYADDVPEGRGPTGKAALKGSYSICSDIENDPDMLPWRDKAISHGFRSSAAFPFRAGSGITGVLTLYSNNPRFLAEEEIHLISSLAEDISFALDVMASEKRRLEAEDELRMLNEELEQRVAARTSDLETANKELESFSYSVSHDLQAPLRHISGFSELLQKNLGERHDKKIIHYASVISEAAKKMAVLIDDLLKFSQIGRAGMRMDRVDLNALVKVVIAEIMEHEKLRRIKWKTAKMPEVMADASMLRLVFVNLVSNAVKFSRSRKVAEIDIGCEEGFGEYVFHIRDNGVGFDMNYADKLFGVFQRLHHADEFEGTGIGLANVRRIVSRHGGRTWAESEAGEGAVFYFSLPRDRGI